MKEINQYRHVRQDVDYNKHIGFYISISKTDVYKSAVPRSNISSLNKCFNAVTKYTSKKARYVSKHNSRNNRFNL